MLRRGRPLAGALVLLGLFGMPAQGAPLKATWGLSLTPFTAALETEVAWEGSPYGISSRLGAMGTPYFTSSDMGLEPRGNWWTTWGHYTMEFGTRSFLRGMLGLSQSWFFGGAPIPFRSWYSSVQPLVPFVGISYEHGWDGGWLRLTPTVTIIPSPPVGSSFDFWEASVLGPPLIEFGFRLDERSEWRLRTSLTPFAYVRSF